MSLEWTVDKSQVPPLQQKRIVAFVNHFLISSCSFLNEFAANCESKFIALERKIQRLEAGLTIIEAKLASIPADTFTTKFNEVRSENERHCAENITEQGASSTEDPSFTPPTSAEVMVRAFEDVRYQKFFKMVRMGVSPDAVKQKMELEGLDSSILDTPNLELPDGIKS